MANGNGWGGARPGAGRPKGCGGQDLVDMVREAFRSSMHQSALDGKPLEQLLLKEMRKNPTRYIDALARFIPKDINIREERSVLDDLTDEELATLVKEARAATSIGEGKPTTKRKKVIR